MPTTYAEHEKKLKASAVCELLPLRDLPDGDNVMIRTNGAFVAGYELRGVLAYFATDGDRNQTKSMLEALFRSVPDVSMRLQFRYEIRSTWVSSLTATSASNAQCNRRSWHSIRIGSGCGDRRKAPATSSRTACMCT